MCQVSYQNEKIWLLPNSLEKRVIVRLLLSIKPCVDVLFGIG